MYADLVESENLHICKRSTSHKEARAQKGVTDRALMSQHAEGAEAYSLVGNLCMSRMEARLYFLP